MTAPATNGRGDWQEWATRKGGFMPPDARNQPPTGAKAPQQGAREERSTATNTATRQMIRLSQKAMIGAGAPAYATRKRGSHRHKAVAGGAGRSLRPKGRG